MSAHLLERASPTPSVQIVGLPGTAIATAALSKGTAGPGHCLPSVFLFEGCAKAGGKARGCLLECVATKHVHVHAHTYHHVISPSEMAAPSTAGAWARRTAATTEADRRNMVDQIEGLLFACRGVCVNRIWSASAGV